MMKNWFKVNINIKTKINFMKTEVIQIVYNSENKYKYGDLRWMIQLPEYNDSLFIYNDNMEHRYSKKHISGPDDIREFPHSAGIVTGRIDDKGFKRLTERIKPYLDKSINNIQELIIKNKYKRVFFLCDQNGLFNTTLFENSLIIKKYITENLINLNLKTFY